MCKLWNNYPEKIDCMLIHLLNNTKKKIGDGKIEINPHGFRFYPNYGNVLDVLFQNIKSDGIINYKEFLSTYPAITIGIGLNSNESYLIVFKDKNKRDFAYRVLAGYYSLDGSIESLTYGYNSIITHAKASGIYTVQDAMKQFNQDLRHRIHLGEHESAEPQLHPF